MALVIIQTAMAPEHHQQMLEYIWKDCVGQVNRGASQLILSAETKNQLGQAGIQDIAGRYAGLVRLSIQVLLDPAFQIVCLRPVQPLHQRLAWPCQSSDLICPSDASAVDLFDLRGSSSHLFPSTHLSSDFSTPEGPFGSATNVSVTRFAAPMPEEPIVKLEVPKKDYKRKIAMVKAEPDDTDMDKKKSKIAVDRQNKIPRPANAFILYRQHHHPEVKANHPGMHNNDISKVIGEQWKNEDDETKASWTEKAEEVKRQHEIEHPDYQYTPRKPSEKKRRVSKKLKPIDDPVDDSVTAAAAKAPKTVDTVLTNDMPADDFTLPTLATRAHPSPSAISFPFRNNLPLTPDFGPDFQPTVHEVIVLDDNNAYDLAGDAGFARMLQDSNERGPDNGDYLGRDKHGEALGQFPPSPATSPGPAFSPPAAFANDMSFEDYMDAEESGQLFTSTEPTSITLGSGSADRPGSSGENAFFRTAMSSFRHDLGLVSADLSNKSATFNSSSLDNGNKKLEQERSSKQSGSDCAKDDDFSILFGSPSMSHQEMEDMFFNFKETFV